MGQQQLLLIVLGVIIVGIAVLVGILLFQHNAVEEKRDLVINESLHIAQLAQQYYLKPSSLAGGNNTFTGWDIPIQFTTGANGSYTASVTPTLVEITGTGNEIVSGSDLIQVKTFVTRDSINTVIIH
ncbi:MAG: hypothetical protein IPJ23_13315 [Ignavibacteriales bacterium]|nr:hypothetical protein [Ignavibacteriales bacterium]